MAHVRRTGWVTPSRHARFLRSTVGPHSRPQRSVTLVRVSIMCIDAQARTVRLVRTARLASLGMTASMACRV